MYVQDVASDAGVVLPRPQAHTPELGSMWRQILHGVRCRVGGRALTSGVEGIPIPWLGQQGTDTGMFRPAGTGVVESAHEGLSNNGKRTSATNKDKWRSEHIMQISLD